MKNDRPRPLGGKPGTDLYGRKILLGVCGGIAAYKAVDLTRQLVKSGARVQVVMTDAATKFVAPLTFETITARHVFVEMFPAQGEFSPWHTEIATWADLAVVAPATANHMARLACGLADDLLSTLMITLERPRVLCPAMNPRMWANPATQDNLATLKRRGYRVIMPEEGQMARPGEDDGLGRLADPETIFREVCHVLSAPQDMRGVRVLVTAGRTEEFWDPVRMLTNRATGRMGFALAEEARERGADVVLIHGPTDVIPPSGVRIRRITTANEMAQAVKQEFVQSNIILMAAAVADYTFTQTAPQKIKKGDPDPEVHLVPTEDILKSLVAKKDGKVIVGFALETENVLDNALKKLREKHLDVVVANNPLIEGAGFAGETNQVLLIHRNGKVVDLPLQSKREIAREILNAVIETYRHPEPEQEEIERQVAEEQAAQFPDYSADQDIEEQDIRHVPANGHSQREPHKPAHPHRHEKPKQKKPQKPPKAQPAPPPAPVAEVSPPPPPQQLAAGPESPPVVDNVEHVASGAAPGPKKSRSRRGGRRAKARAAKLAARAAAEAQGGQGHPPVADAPVAHDKVPGPTAPRPEPEPKPVPSPEPSPPHEPIPQLRFSKPAPPPPPPVMESLPAEAVSPADAVATKAPAKKRARRVASTVDAEKPKPATRTRAKKKPASTGGDGSAAAAE